jgi:hypothetical protein
VALDEDLAVAPGRHRLVVRSARLGAQRKLVVVVGAGQKRLEQVTLGRGTLRIGIHPWGKVSIDGRTAGVTPLAPIPLYEGPHTVEVENPALGRKVVRTVQVAPGRETALVLRLSSAPPAREVTR